MAVRGSRVASQDLDLPDVGNSLNQQRATFMLAIEIPVKLRLGGVTY